MPRKVVFVEELGSLCRLWDQSVGLADVPDDDLANIGAELLSRQLQIFICLELLLSERGELADLLLTQLHEFLLPLQIALLVSIFDRLNRRIDFIADCVGLSVALLKHSLSYLLRLGTINWMASFIT